MIHGETVIVGFPEEKGRDSLNNPIIEWEDVEVSNVLVCPVTQSDMSEADRPNAVRVVYNLHFPKTFTGSLRGCKVNVRGEWLGVVGDPRPYTDANVPGSWNMPVEVGVFDG